MKQLQLVEMPESPVLSVGSITDLIKQKLETDPKLKGIKVRGEVSNFTASSAGHFYFTMKDEDAELPCVMFASSASKVKFDVQTGMGVIAYGNVTVYKDKGKYQLLVTEMEPDGLGTLYAEFLKLQDKLRKEGLFDTAVKREIPQMPMTIGVVTSLQAAALRDILNVLKRRWPVAEVIISPAYVQGNGAAGTICEALERLEHLPTLTGGKKIDVAIVSRGGGSLEDLWAFNEECLARTIRATSFPVVSGVGHETDVTICDHAADYRAPTPSAAAEVVVPVLEDELQQLDDILWTMDEIMVRRLEALEDEVANDLRLLESFSPSQRIHDQTAELERTKKQMDTAMVTVLDCAETDLARLSQRLDDLAPLQVLDRGYAIVTKQDAVVGKAGELATNDDIEIMFTDGEAEAKVSRIKLKKEGDKDE